METRASYILVGAFVLSFFVAVLLAVLWLADVDVDSESTLYDIYFEGPVSGLNLGSAVRYDGIPVGVVSDLQISADRFGEVRVVVEVPRDLPIREDAVARLESQGITGIGFIEINGGTEAAAPLTARRSGMNPEIASEKSALQQVFDSAPVIMKNLEDAVLQVTKLLNDDTIGSLNETLGNINDFSGALADSSGDVALLLQEGASTMVEIRSTASEAERLVSAFADRAEDISGATEDTIFEAQALVQDVRAFTARLDGLVAQVEPTLAQANRTMTTYADLGEELRGQTGELTETLQSTLENADALMVTAGSQVEAVSGRAAETLQAYDDLAGTIAPMVEDVSRDASAAVGDFAAISGEMRSAATNIAAAADEARLLIAENRAPVTNFSATGLYEFTQLLAEMRVLVGSLTRITNQIERDPAQFFFGDSQQGFEVQ